MSVRTMLYVEGHPIYLYNSVILVNETLGGYQVITGVVSDPETKKEKLHIKHNEFYPRDKYTLITTNNGLSYGMQPSFIDHDTLKVHSFTMESEDYAVDDEAGIIVSAEEAENEHDFDFEYGVAHKLADKKEHTVSIANQDKEKVREDELKERLKAKKFKLVTNNLLYDPESRIAIVANTDGITALRITEGWKPFTVRESNIYVVKDNIPYGSLNVNASDVGVMNVNSTQIKHHNYIILPIPSNGLLVQKTKSNTMLTSGGDVLPHIASDRIKFIGKTPLSYHTVVVTQSGDIYTFKFGNVTKYKTPKQELQTIAVAMSDIQPKQEFTVLDSIAGITYGIDHYEIDKRRCKPANDQLYATDPIEEQLLPLVKDNTFQANEARIKSKLSEVCSEP